MRMPSRSAWLLLALSIGSVLAALLIGNATALLRLGGEIFYSDPEHDALIARSMALLERSKCRRPLYDRLVELAEADDMESDEATSILKRLENDECAP